MESIALVLTISLIGLAGLHLHWAFGGRWGVAAAIPETDGEPAFSPGPAATIAVAGALTGFAYLAFALEFEGVFARALAPYAAILGYFVGGIFLLRSIGDFRYMGFFKRVTGTRFAAFDSWLFSPYCLMAGAAFIALAATRPTGV